MSAAAQLKDPHGDTIDESDVFTHAAIGLDDHDQWQLLSRHNTERAALAAIKSRHQHGDTRHPHIAQYRKDQS